MAQKRMFDKKVVGSDKFIDLPNSSKALYFMAGMEADDKGFFQPRKLQKLCGFSDDDYKILIAKGFFIAFESGVMVVTDWNKNNWLDSRRITETEYIDELNMLKLINQKYEINDSCLANAKPMLRENSIEENRIVENSIDILPDVQMYDKSTLEIEKDIDKKHKYGEYKNVLLKDTEYQKLKEEYSNADELIKFLDEYIEMKGYKAKSHYLCIKKWVVDAVKQNNTKDDKKTKRLHSKDLDNKSEEYWNDFYV